MRLRPEARVGLIVFIALVGFIIVYAFFGRGWIGSGNYPVCAVFDDVLRLSRGADVRMSGVRIGSVQEIELTSSKKAKVTMAISKKYEKDIREDSTARITTGGLIGVGEYYVEILPGSSNKPLGKGCLKSMKMPNLDDVMVQVTGIVADLKTSINSINNILQNKQMKQTMQQILDNVKKTSETSVQIADQMKSVIGTSQPQLQAALQNVVNASGDLAGAMKYVRTAIEAGSPDSIKKALDSVDATAKNFEDASAALKNLAQDKQIACDIKGTASEIHGAAASAHQAAQGAVCIVNQLQQLSGKLNSLKPGPPAGFVPDIGSRFDFLVQSGDDPTFRFDYNYTMPWDYDQFFRLGATSIGQSTGVNLQAGQSLGDFNAFRAGLISSQIGVGYDHLFNDKLAFEFNMYDPNELTFDAMLKYELNRELRAELGLIDNNAFVGVQYKK